jgi:hypothetical protein
MVNREVFNYMEDVRARPSGGGSAGFHALVDPYPEDFVGGHVAFELRHGHLTTRETFKQELVIRLLCHRVYSR